MSKNNPVLPATVSADLALDCAVRVIHHYYIRRAFLLFEACRQHNPDSRDAYLAALALVIPRIGQTFACLLRREIGERKFARVRAANRGREVNQATCASRAFAPFDELMDRAMAEVLGRQDQSEDGQAIRRYLWPLAWQAANLR